VRNAELDLSRVSHVIANASMGTSSARRVVIPPGIVEAMGEGRLRTALKEQRAVNDRLIADVIAAKRNVIDAFTEVGLTAHQSVSGRVTRPK
jgi:hypothetical protein